MEPAANTTPQTTTPPATASAEPPAVAPEAYADFTAPDGATLDKDAIAAAAPLFKELNLTQEQAQKLVTLTASREADLGKAAKSAQEAAFAETNATWQREAKAEWGSRLDSEVLPVISRAIEALPEAVRAPFREAVNLTGAGNNPAFIRVFYEMAKRQGEGTAVPAAAPAPAPNGRAANPGFTGSLYPDHPRQ